ncbi:macrolide family glycosyltransferase [Streptomyces sp. NPDC006622]|uniref:macrolide family glycosyltransferase n=1 Tax=Streptomyces sp. NPDC006622 TaxID=3155459 RepID=UPI0033B4CE0A
MSAFATSFLNSPAAEASRKAHVAVFNVPQPGHVFPTLAVVELLVARGHRVSYAVTAEFESCVRAAGADPVLYHAPDLREAREDLAEGVAQAVVVNLAAMAELGLAFEADRPDVVLHDVYAWAGPLLATRWSVPALQLAPTHVPYEGMIRDFFDLDDISQIPGFPELAGALAANGLGSVHELTLAPPRVVAFFPRSFQRRPETVAAGECHYVGPALSQRSFQGSWQRPMSGHRVLLVSLGSQFTRRPAFYRACIEAFTDSQWHVVMTIGAAVNPAELGKMPANFEVHARVPQLEVLAVASAFITHGGMGSTMEGLVHGVPLVAVPQMAEQRVNAAQIEKLGVGVHLPPEEATGRALREAVEQVADDQDIAAHVKEFGRQIEKAGGAAAAVAIVEKLLRPALATSG